MPRVSNSSLHLVVREEEHNTHDSDPKVEKEKKKKKDFAKLKDSADPKDTSLTEQQKAFELWCYCYKRTYSNQAEKKMRLGIFQKALSLPKSRKALGGAYPGYADLTREELKDKFKYRYAPRPPAGCYVFPSDVDISPGNDTRREYWNWNVESSDEEFLYESSDDEECSDLDEDYAQYLRLLEQSSDGTL